MKVRKLSAILLAGALMATPVVTSTAMAESSAAESVDSTQNIVDESGNLEIEGTVVTGVTEQGEEAKEIKIPEGVTKIGDDAFSGCTNLENVDIPDSVTEIGYAAFSFCKNLTELVLGNGVVSIGGGVIRLCDNLKSITFGDSLKEIDREFFADNSSVESINVSANNEYYSSENGVLFNKDKTVLIKYPSAKKDKSYTVPETVTSLKGGLGSTVVSFYGTIDSPYLESITLPEGIKEIPALAFTGSGIKSITIPKSVTYIGVSAFNHCSNLESIVIPDGVTTIDGAAFGFCDKLKTVYIPASATKLGEDIYGAFTAKNITDIYYSGTEEQWTKIGNMENNSFPETATIHYNYSLTSEFTDETTGVTASADKGVLPENAKLSVEPIAEKTDSTKVTYEITITENDKEIQPDGKVTVKIPVPEAMKGKTVYVYRVEADGTYTNMNAKVDGNVIVFETKHFSEYVVTTDGTLADKATEDSDSEPSSDSETTSDNEATSSDSNTSNSGADKENADTGFGGIAMTLGIVALAGAAIVVSGKRK